MRKTNPINELTEISTLLRANPIPYDQVFDALGKKLRFQSAIMVSTVPRGNLQIVQPARIEENLLRDYLRAGQWADRLTWETIFRTEPVLGSDCWPEGVQESAFYRDFLRSHNLSFVAAVPLAAPVLDGYPGALVVLRTAEQGDFGESDLTVLRSAAEMLDAAIAKQREERQSKECDPRPSWAHTLPVKLFVFDANLKQRYPASTPDELDPRFAAEMKHFTSQRLQQINGQPMFGDRLQLADSRGDLWTFRVITYKEFPALGEGPFIFWCLQPECCDWGTVLPEDFQADGEFSRLVPAMAYMQNHFHRGPTLGDIAKAVHLSPFHFHRRFSELMGLTPKHFLLECQIYKAKSQLSAQRELSEIASECGFAHQSHFTSRFKQSTGLTPTRWRRLVAEPTDE